LTKQINQLKNTEKELDLNIKLFQSLNQNPNIQQLLNSRKLLNAWLPLEPEIEELIFFLYQSMQSIGVNISGINFSISDKNKIFNSNVLPVIPVTVSFNAFLSDKIFDVIKAIESSTRILVIKNIKLDKEWNASIEVESYYLPTK
jgi:hypothetical protein